MTDKTDADGMWVRSRDKRSSEILADWLSEQTRGGEEVRIQEWKGRDYDYRLQLGREEWAQYVAHMAMTSVATNFKTQVGKNLGHGSRWLKSLHDVWSIMYKLQSDLKHEKLEPGELDIELNEWEEFEAWSARSKAVSKGRKLWL